MTLARQHFQKHQAKKAAVSAAEFGAMQDMTAYELQMMQLNNDRQRLKQIQAKDAKVVLKTALLPNYLPYIEGILEADKSIQDEVFMTILVWCIDVGDYAKALLLAEFALRHNMIMPDAFKRNTATYIVETIAEVYLKQLKTNAIVDISVLEQQIQQITDYSNYEVSCIKNNPVYYNRDQLFYSNKTNITIPKNLKINIGNTGMGRQ